MEFHYLWIHVDEFLCQLPRRLSGMTPTHIRPLSSDHNRLVHPCASASQPWPWPLACLTLAAMQCNRRPRYRPATSMGNQSHGALICRRLDVEEAVLQRGRTDNAVGGFHSTGAGPVPVFSISSPQFNNQSTPPSNECLLFCLHRNRTIVSRIMHPPAHSN